MSQTTDVQMQEADSGRTLDLSVGQLVALELPETTTTTSTPPPVPAAFDARCYYRWTTLWQGEGMSLDIVNDSKANNIPILAKTGCNDSGQLWKVTTVPVPPEHRVEDSP